MHNQKNSRYPGLRPFQTNEQQLFFGRSREIKELSQLIQTERLSVLFAKSGLGKSSILNAGVLPLLEDDIYRSIQIRVQNRGIAPIEAVEKQAESYAKVVAFEAKAQKRLKELEKVTKRPATLWEKLRAYNFEAELGITAVLVFDQFEEFFLHEPAAQKEFVDFLADLAYERVPLYLQYTELSPDASAGKIKTVLKNSKEEEESLSQALFWWRRPLDYKVVIAIRSDKLSFLDRLSSSIPSILHHRYELKALQREQARDAIIFPATTVGTHYNTPIFDYSEKALNDILDSLSDDKGNIESFQLQIICQHVEQKIAERAADTDKLQVEPNDLGGNDGIQNILNNYYNTQIRKIQNPEERLAARRLIEEGLIVDGTRVSLGEASVRNSFNISDELLQELLATRLIRIENTHLGKAYEVSHDTLVEPISKSAELRLQKEAELKLQQELAIERRKKRRARRINIAFMLFSLLALGLLVIVYFFYQSSIWENKRLKVVGQVAESSIDLVGGEYREVIEKSINVLKEVNETFTNKEHLKINKEYATATKNLYNAFYSNQEFFEINGRTYNRPPMIRTKWNSPFYFQLTRNSHVMVEPDWTKQVRIFDRKTYASAKIPFCNPMKDKIIGLANGHQAWIKTMNEKGINFWDGERYLTSEDRVQSLISSSPDGKTVICSNYSDSQEVFYTLYQCKEKIERIYSSSATETLAFEHVHLGNKGLYFAEENQLFFMGYENKEKQLVYKFQFFIDNIKVTNRYIILFNKWNEIEIIDIESYKSVERFEIDPMMLNFKQQGASSYGDILPKPEEILGPDERPASFSSKSLGRGTKRKAHSSIVSISDYQWIWSSFYIEWNPKTGFQISAGDYGKIAPENTYKLDENRWMTYSLENGGSLYIYEKDKNIARWQNIGKNLYFSIFSSRAVAAYNTETLETKFLDLEMIPMEAIHEPFDFSLANDIAIAAFSGKDKCTLYTVDSVINKITEIQFEEGVEINKKKQHEINLHNHSIGVFNTQKSAWQLYNVNGKLTKEIQVEKEYDYLSAQPQGVHLLSLQLEANGNAFNIQGEMISHLQASKINFISETATINNATNFQIARVEWLDDLDPSFVTVEISYLNTKNRNTENEKFCLQLKPSKKIEKVAFTKVEDAIIMMEERLLIAIDKDTKVNEFGDYDYVLKAYDYDFNILGIDSLGNDLPELFQLTENQILLWRSSYMIIKAVSKESDGVNFNFLPKENNKDPSVVFHKTELNHLSDFYLERHGIIGIGHERSDLKKRSPSVVFAPEVEDGLFLTISDVLVSTNQRQKSYLSKDGSYIFVEVPLNEDSSKKKMIRYILDYNKIDELFKESQTRINEDILKHLAEDVRTYNQVLNDPPFFSNEEDELME